MARHLFIVSRHHASLHDNLQERFRGDTKAEVILDRRMAERRSAAARGLDSDLRRSDRRTRAEIDLELRTRSHVIVTLPRPDLDAAMG